PASSSDTSATAQKPAGNPFFAASSLPFQAPDFNAISDTDYLPAFEEGMRQQLAEIEKITANKEPATFDNTLLPLERSGAVLVRVNRVFGGVVQADTNPERQKIQEIIAPKLAEHSDAIHLDDALF